jgi:hypothetical protein
MTATPRRILFLAFLCAALVLCYRHWSSAAPVAIRLENQAYVWQTRWNDDVLAAIKRAEPQVDGFMVLMGEAAYDGKDFSFSPACPVSKAAGRPVTFVLRAKNSLLSAVKNGKRTEAVAYLADRLRPFLNDTTPSENRVQLDFDFPTRSLKEYAELIGALRKSLPVATFSITALPDWLNSDAFIYLVGNVDYFVLQVHGLQKPTGADAPYSLCDPDAARRHVDRAARVGKPFYIALPTYAYRLLFDNHGEFRTITAEQNSELPPPGWHVRQVSADPAQTALLVRHWREDIPKDCLGFAWFRLPVDSDRHNLPWPAFQSVMAGNAPTLSFAAEMRQPEPGLYELWLANSGDYAPSDPVSCEVRWKNDAVQSYDIIGGYKGKGAFGQDCVQLTGPAPEAGAPPQAVGWFRVRPEHNEDKEVVQCSAVHIVNSSGT